MESTTFINVDSKGSETVITSSGALDLSNSDEFEDALKQASTTQDSVVVNFENTPFIDTAILEDLVIAAKAMSRRGKRLKVVVQSGSHPQHVLITVGFAKVMDIVTDDGSDFD